MNQTRSTWVGSVILYAIVTIILAYIAWHSWHGHPKVALGLGIVAFFGVWGLVSLLFDRPTREPHT